MELRWWFVLCSVLVVGWKSLRLRATVLMGLARWSPPIVVAWVSTGVCGCDRMGLVERRQVGWRCWLQFWQQGLLVDGFPFFSRIEVESVE